MSMGKKIKKLHSPRCYEKMLILCDNDLCIIHNLILRRINVLTILERTKSFDFSDEIEDLEHVKSLIIKALTL